MKKTRKQCQSCGMPFKKEDQRGLEKDGTRSAMYCSLCYKDGEFINPDMTLQQMQELVDDVLKNEMKSGRIFRWMAKKQIPTLKRWKQK